ncbi:zf-C3HC-domain-containing protein [Pleurotus eryngii]|uniref:Zf-C3HC-domain-containing protein n=1 Tax=Pleurotus eryngii TaxID=5323 RepID=A0A9P6A400_PLEER|nr:zf-C3HC-domain-containing protein [Pleurotus eryngii]
MTEPPPSDGTSGTHAGSSIRAMKRKLDDAFSSLDEAVKPQDDSERPPPAKRTLVTRSLYSTLAKYGIKTKSKEPPPLNLSSPFDSTLIMLDLRALDATEKLSTLSKPTPHLTAILSRAASRTRKALPSFKFPSLASSASLTSTIHNSVEYRPSSTPSFLSRLATFKLTTYANKPTPIDAVAAAKCGWINDGKDRLVCGLCGVSWVVAEREGMSRDAANALVEKQRNQLVQSHKDGCPWKTRQCDDSIYRIQLKPPATTVQELKSSALALDTVLQGVEIKHPLTSAQLSTLKSTVSSFTLPPSISDLTIGSETPNPSPPSEPSETAILTALFGWSIVPPPTAGRPKYSSISRAASLFPSRSSTPSISRAASLAPSRAATPNPPTSISRAGTPSRGSPSRLSSISTAGIAPNSRVVARPLTTRSAVAGNEKMLHCVLCQRRVGLWAFAPVVPAASSDSPQVPPLPSSIRTSRRQFDLLKEHRSYCPFVVKSTIVPALPVPPPSTGSSPAGDASTTGRFNFSVYSLSSQALTAAGVNNAMEGWRAVLTVIVRYGLSQRQRKLTRSVTTDTDASTSSKANDGMEVDGVEAMVEGVKRRGGKDLLRYVKGLLG